MYTGSMSFFTHPLYNLHKTLFSGIFQEFLNNYISGNFKTLHFDKKKKTRELSVNKKP